MPGPARQEQHTSFLGDWCVWSGAGVARRPIAGLPARGEDGYCEWITERSPSQRVDMPDDLIVHHPPERGTPTHRSVVVYMCCTSCCCLHTAGALLGALLGGGLIRAPDDPGFDPERRIPVVHWLFDRLPRTQWLFWSSLVGVFVASLPVCVLLARGIGVGELPFVPLIAFVLFGPAYFLVAWLVSLVRLSRWSPQPATRNEFWALHKSLCWALIGSALGLAIMILVIVLLQRDRTVVPGSVGFSLL